MIEENTLIIVHLIYRTKGEISCSIPYYKSEGFYPSKVHKSQNVMVKRILYLKKRILHALVP